MNDQDAAPEPGLIDKSIPRRFHSVCFVCRRPSVVQWYEYPGDGDAVLCDYCARLTDMSGILPREIEE